ncbi:MAG: ABC transporter ATP-binding protein [Firmicutes bacterium]|nr:ABC transporter ATP-binding protein [Bacillota bacterium]
MLQITEVDIYYGDVQAIKEVDLNVGENEIVFLLGSNGGGKSSLLRAISGIVPIQNGQILFKNERIDGLTPWDIAELGLIQVPENRQLFPLMTVLENLQLGAYSRRARGRKEKELELVFELFPILKERANQVAGTLSGGEQQMLALGRGLMSAPSLLMLDEPSFGLAPKVTYMLFDAIAAISRQGIPILVAEQNVNVVLPLAKRGYVIETGQIVLEGTSKELTNNDHVRQAYLGM